MHVCMLFLFACLLACLNGGLVRCLAFKHKKIIWKWYRNPTKSEPKSSRNRSNSCIYRCAMGVRSVGVAVGVQGGNRSQGVPKIATKKRRWKKEGVPLTRPPPLILEENRLQDGARNQYKINISAINFQSFFLIHFWEHLGCDLGRLLGPFQLMLGRFWDNFRSPNAKYEFPIFWYPSDGFGYFFGLGRLRILLEIL